jgi:hypothetical protein
MSNNSFPEIAVELDRPQMKYITAHELCMLDDVRLPPLHTHTHTHTHTQTVSDSYCFSVTTMVAQTRLNFT